jgi:hypothetical protein
MTCGRKTLTVKRETSLGRIVAPKASFMKRIPFRGLNDSRLTFYEQRDYSQAGR